MSNTKFRILILNGPNLNFLGKREPDIYGSNTLFELVQDLLNIGNSLGVYIDHFQSNAEYKLIDRLYNASKNVDFIIVNPSGLTHTSIILRDAFLSVNIPFIEVHLSNIYKRESFRQCSYFSDIAVGIISGFGVGSYHCALHMAVKYLLKFCK